MALLNPVTDFGLNLLNQTSASESVVLSTLSISLALALVHAGAGGNTKDQIREAMAKGSTDNQLIDYYKQIGGSILNSEKVKLLIANRMYINESFEVKQSYLGTISQNYHAKAEILNFSQGKKAADTVNGFVKEVTHDMIKELVKEDAFEDAVAFLVNAIYFDGKWAVPFMARQSQEGDFYPAPGQSKKVQYLRDLRVTRLYSETEEAQILTLKYEDRAFSFSLVLPNERIGLEKLRASLTGEKLQEMLGSVKDTYINIQFPKFKIEKEMDLKKALEALGVVEVFTNRADLSGIARNIRVSDALHKAVIEVDEAGTKAAAATAIRLVPVMARRDKPKDFTANRPFLFVLRHQDSVLFIGHFNG